MRWVLGSAILFFGAMAPALAQGPMSPVSLSNKPVETAEPAAPALPAQPPVVLPSAPVAAPDLAAAAQPAARTKKRVAKKAVPKEDVTAERVDVTAERVDATDVSDLSDTDRAAKRSPKRQRIDPDHMAGLLNRMQLEGGYGAAPPPGMIMRMPPSAGE